MKSILLFSFITINLLAFGQKRLTSQVTYSYEMNGTIYGIDSIQKVFASQQAGINSFSPTFLFDGTFHNYSLFQESSNFNVSPDQSLFYGGTSHPLTYSVTYTNLLSNGLVTQTSSGGNWRTIHEYDMQGNKTKETTQISDNGTWIPVDSTTYTFDIIGNQLTRSTYDVMTLDALVYADTSTYVSGTNQLSKFISYLPVVFGGNLEPNQQTVISYNGTQIDFEDYSYNFGSGGLEWINQAIYEYINNKPVNYSLYDVQNNVVAASPNEITLFQSNAQNLHQADVKMTASGDTLSMNLYEYDFDGFVTRAENIALNFDSELYTSRLEFFYFEQAPLGLPTLSSDVSVYPNPASDKITINSTSPIKTIQLLNLSGQVLMVQNSNELEIAHLPSGKYILIGDTEDGQFTAKITKW